jgi:competence protein ComEA
VKGRFKDYLTFTKSERIGITILLSIIVIILIIPGFVKNTFEREGISNELYKAEVDEFLKGIKMKEEIAREKDYAKPSQERKSGKRFTPHLFDPNSACKGDYVMMGFSEKQAASIIKYRNKGGSFRRKEDFKKLFVVDEETYRIFEPYIRFSDTSGNHEGKNSADLKAVHGFGNSSGLKADHDVELNSADSVELLKINGVGPVFASRILKHRKKLGGFSDIDQLHEIYGIDSAKFSHIAKQVILDSALILKINVNTVAINELKKHPYLDYYLAKAIIDKRIQRGGYSNIDDLKEIFRNKPGLFEKISPYLTGFSGNVE